MSWRLVDEETPRDRDILIWSEGNGREVAWWNGDCWETIDDHGRQATLWQPLPAEPGQEEAGGERAPTPQRRLLRLLLTALLGLDVGLAMALGGNEFSSASVAGLTALAARWAWTARM